MRHFKFTLYNDILRQINDSKMILRKNQT